MPPLRIRGHPCAATHPHPSLSHSGLFVRHYLDVITAGRWPVIVKYCFDNALKGVACKRSGQWNCHGSHSGRTDTVYIVCTMIYKYDIHRLLYRYTIQVTMWLWWTFLVWLKRAAIVVLKTTQCMYTIKCCMETATFVWCILLKYIIL